MGENDKLHNLRHSLAHLLAAAVLEIYPDTKNTIGPSIEDGFYYDFDFQTPGVKIPQHRCRRFTKNRKENEGDFENLERI